MNVNTTNTYSTSSATNKGMSGMISGMDTESMVDQMLSGTQNKIDKQEQEKQKIIWQQLKYREIISELNKFQDTFFGSTSSTNLGSIDFFNAMSVISSSKAFSAIATSDAAMGNTSIRVGQLATASYLKSGQTVSGKLTGSQAMNLDALKREVVFNVGGDEVKVELESLTGKDEKEKLDNLAKQLNDNKNFKAKGLTAEIKDGKLQISGKDFSISAKSSALGMNMLGVTAGQKSEEGSLTTAADVDAAVSFKVELNGISRTITLDGLDKNSTSADVIKKAQEQIDKEFGKGWITVKNDGGRFSLTTGGKGNVATITGDQANLKLLGVQSGQSNKIARGQMLKDTQFATALQGDKFEFSINGVNFKFDGESTINDVIKTVNSSNAGVRLTYSDLEDKFTIESTETGAGRSIDLVQKSGNLLNAMFGEIKGLKTGSEVSSRQLVKNFAASGDAKDFGDTIEGGYFTFKVDGKSYSISIPKNTSRDEAFKLINEGLATRFGYGADGKQAIEMTGDKTNGYRMEVRNGSKITFEDMIPEGTADADIADKLKDAAKSSVHVAFGFNGVDNVVKEDEIATLTLKDVGIANAKNPDMTIAEYMDSLKTSSSSAGSLTPAFEDGRIVLTADGDGYVGRNETEYPELTELFGGFIQMNKSAGDDAAEIVEGQNAIAEINGVVVERSTNTFTTAGMTITLNEPTETMPKLTSTGNPDEYKDESGVIYKLVNGQIQDENGKVMEAYKGMSGLNIVDGRIVDANGDKVIGGSTETISTSRNTDKIVEGLKSFVDQYNTMIDKLNTLIHADATYRDYPPLTSAQKKEMSEKEIELWEEKAQEGLLRNDSDISSFLQNMRTALYAKPEGAEYALYDIGIESSSEWRDYGKLEFDEAKVRSMVESNPQAVQELFTNATNGLATLMNKELDRTAKTSSSSAGTLVEKAGVQGKATAITNQMTQRLISINERIDELKKRYETEKTRYWNQFNAMEKALANMSSQSSWLAMQFSY